MRYLLATGLKLASRVPHTRRHHQQSSTKDWPAWLFNRLQLLSASFHCTLQAKTLAIYLSKNEKFWNCNLTYKSIYVIQFKGFTGNNDFLLYISENKQVAYIWRVNSFPTVCPIFINVCLRVMGDWNSLAAKISKLSLMKSTLLYIVWMETT